jgi:divalent metal cation (Fe/Co/Zn/Cd) transporter
MNKPTPKSPADARWETVSQTIVGVFITAVGAIGTLTKGQWLLKHKTMRNIAGVIAAVGLAWIYNYIVGQLLKGIVW